MSNFIRPWDVNQEAAAEEAKPKRGLFDNLGDAFSAISANFDDVRGSERLGDLRNELMNPELSDEEYNRKRGEYVQEYLNREDARRRYAEAHQNLVNDDSFLKNIDQMGGTLEGMAAQGIGTAVGAGVGFLTPVVGGTAMGAKIGNAAGAVAGAHLDARSVALQAEEDVINAGGTWEQAKQAYDETLKKAYITTIPETAADIVLGSRIGGAALNSGVARKIAGSTVGRVGASVLDPAAKIGTAVSRATRPIIGRGAGLLTDIGLQAGTEALQEVSQDYIADREVAKALGKQDNEYSLGGFKDYALSPQGLETIKTSAIMGGLFGGVGGVLSSGQYLQRGSDTVMGNKGYHAANDAIQEGLLKLDDSGRLAAEKYIHQATGVSEAELATWSDADIISQYASSFAKRHNPNSTESMDASVTRGIAEAVRTTVDPKEIYGTREGDLTASQKIVLEKMGIDPDTTQEMFSSPAEKSVMEKAREEVSEGQNEEDKPAINAKMSAKLKEEIDANNGKTVQEVHQEEMAKNGNTNQQTTGNTDGVIGDIKYKNKVGNIEGEEWIRVPYTTSDGQELEGARYENKKTGKTATITQNNDGTFSVRDESNVSAHVFNTLEDAEKFLNKHRNDTKMFMKEGTDNTSEEIQDPNVVPEGGVNAETSGYTGVQINNISDLSSFMDKNQGLIDPEWFRQFIAITRSISPENWQLYLDTKNRGYVYDNGRWGEVRGYADKDKSMGRAIVQLYAGADIGTAIHEIAHHGFWNLSERDRDIFTRYATKSMGKFVANLLDREYDNNFIAELRNIKEGDALYNQIVSNACLGQVKYLLNTLNLQSLGITDISKVSPDQIELFREQQRQAVEERWAWEFSNWYVEGYVKGYTGNNIIQRILQRGCMSMEDSLTCIQKLWEHLHHRNSESETPIEDLYRSMNHPREQERTQSAQEQTQSNPEQEQFTNEFYNPYEFEGNPDIEQPTQFMDSSEYTGDNADTNNQEYVRNEEQNYNTQEQDFGNQEQNSNNTQGEYYYNPNDNSYNESEEESQLNIKMTDETAEIFADEMLRRYGDNYEQMKSVWQNLYRNAKSRREQNWLVRMMRIAAKKYKEGQKANAKQTRKNTRQTPNNIGIEQRQVSVQGNQPVGVQERNSGYFNPNPLQLNQAQEQEKQQTQNTPQQQEEQQKKPNVPQQEEVVDNNVEEEVEEKWTIRGTVGDTNERLGKIYKLGLEPREIDSIHLEINEVLDELEGDSDKTVTKIRQSVTKRINAAKAALRGSKKSVDRNTDFYKLCSMSSLEETLNHYLNDNYYEKGNANQEKVNYVGNLIKRQLGEEVEEWAQPYSDETERAGRKEKSEADRIEKERKQAEKEAKKKQQQQVESASQRLDILEQQVRNQQGEELTDEELEEKLESEVKKDNIPTETKNITKERKFTQQDGLERVRKIAKNSNGIAVSKKELETYNKTGKVPEKVRQIREQQNNKKQQTNDVVDGWVEKLSKEEDYDEAMSKLQELLNTNEITEEEYNDISRRIEDYFEGEEDNTSGRSYQKVGSSKKEQNEFFVNGENITDKLNDIFFDTDFGYHLFGDNLSKEQVINELKQQLLQTNKDKREYMRFFETSSKEDIDNFGDRWKRKIDGLTESIKDLKEVLNKINKGDLVVKNNQQKYNGSNVIDITNRIKKNTRRFMNIGKRAKGSPITQDVLNKVEKEYNEKMQDKGVSVIQLLQMKYRNELSEKQGRENVSDIDDAIFSREYIQAHDEVNKEMFKKYKLFRGLDGEWRYRISDNTAKLTFEGIDMQEEARDNKLSGFTSNAFYKLGDLFKHNTLFKYYPEFKDINVQFIYDEESTKVGNYIDGENGNVGTLTINLGHGKFINKKTLNSQIVKTMLHELQHAIQDKEGFASGGTTDSNSLYKKSAVGFINRNKLNIINSFAKFLQGKGQTIYEMEMNGNKQEISDSMEKNVSGDFVPVVYINKQRKSGIQGGVLFSLMMSMNDAYFENATLSQRDFDFVRDMLQSEKEIKYLDKLEQMFKDGKFNMGFSTQSFTKEQALNKAKQELSFLNDKKGIEKVISEYELGYGNNEAFETALDESGLEFDFYRSLYGEMEARDTAENYRNKNRNRFVPISEEGEYIKAKLGSGQVRINKRRYMAAQEKTATEKAQEQRDKRFEQQREAGITSDMYKDVYSVTFEKDATSNAENKRKMEYFDKRSKFWDKTEKNGRVIYTRKTPLDHHQKVIRYSGINDVEKTDKKKSKPEQWLEWAKDQLIKYAFNDMHFLAKAARKLGVYDSYVKLAVTKGYALKANTAMQRGIKYNGKYTRALNDIIKEVGEEKQHDFVEYCIAKRILDMKELRPEIRQKMSPEEAQDIVDKVEKGADAKLFMKNQKDFVQYNHALLHVLVDGGVISEEEFQHHIKNDPNFVPLAKVMDDADFGFNCIQAARSIVNVKSPIKKIGTSMRETKNPFLEMQKRTAEYYAIASRNKAGQIFVNEIAGVLEKNAKGDTIAKGQGMIRKVKINEKDGKLITKPDQSQQIIYISNNGKQEFYQVSDPEIYRALRALDADQMGTLHKMLDPFLHAPSALIRETATMVPDFGVRNLVRDGGEAFMTSEHGFLPLIDQIWGMYQMANNTEWYQRFLEQQGEYGTYNREGANDNVARVEDTIDEKVNVLKNFNAIREAAFKKLTNKKNSKLTRAAALLQLMGSIPYAFIKSNKRINDYLEMGTRIGEFKNAKMGYDGTLDRLSKGGILDWGADINKAKQSDILAAGAAKEITLNFSQHGIIGKQLNRYIPFFNATLQGIYKMCNALELMATGTTLSGEKNSKLQHELLFKAALTTAMAIGIAAAGEGDDDYEEANQYEKENFWILPNGLRFPKDQVLGKLFGNVAEKSYAQWRKGKFEPSDILRSIKENFTPDRFMPATADIVLGGLFNYDSFYKSAIVPEYMQNKLGHLQKDLSTSNMASDVSNFLWKYTRTDVSAKRLDWSIQKNLTNCKKYVDAIYDLCKQTYDPKSFNEKMARGYDKNDSTGAFVGGLKDDIPKPLSLITGTFATNRTNYKSISDFYEKYNEYKTLATDEGSMSKEEKRTWKRYEQAYKKDKNYRKQLRAIKQDSSLTGKEKREKADKIFKQQIKLAKWAEG